MLPNSRSTTPTGKKGEDAAIAFLQEAGYTILERNYHFERAEVDIVAYDNNRIIFIEVKTRSGISFEAADDSVSHDQEMRIRKAAQAWLYERKMEGSPVRFDLISVLFSGGVPTFNHYKQAFF